MIQKKEKGRGEEGGGRVVNDYPLHLTCLLDFVSLPQRSKGERKGEEKRNRQWHNFPGGLSLPSLFLSKFSRRALVRGEEGKPGAKLPRTEENSGRRILFLNQMVFPVCGGPGMKEEEGGGKETLKVPTKRVEEHSCRSSQSAFLALNNAWGQPRRRKGRGGGKKRGRCPASANAASLFYSSVLGHFVRQCRARGKKKGKKEERRSEEETRSAHG